MNLLNFFEWFLNIKIKMSKKAFLSFSIKSDIEHPVTQFLLLNKKIGGNLVQKQNGIIKEYYGNEDLKDIYTEILIQEFMKINEEKIQRGWKDSEK